MYHNCIGDRGFRQRKLYMSAKLREVTDFINIKDKQ